MIDVLLLDVNETLSDLEPLRDRFVAAGLPAHSLDAWFAATLSRRRPDGAISWPMAGARWCSSPGPIGPETGGPTRLALVGRTDDTRRVDVVGARDRWCA